MKRIPAVTCYRQPKLPAPRQGKLCFVLQKMLFAAQNQLAHDPKSRVVASKVGARNRYVKLMDMDSNKRANRGGRKPKPDPCRHRHVFYLNDTDNCRLDAMYLQSGITEMSRFLRSIIFNKPIKVVKIDKATMDYYMRLTGFYSQFQAVGVNYNQTVKAIKTNFLEKRALVLLRQLEKTTFELVAISKKVMELTKEFELRIENY